MLNSSTSLEAANSFISNLSPYPDRYEGCGIIIPAGGTTYFANAWVCIHMLRFHGCNLPIQLWHLGEHEMDNNMCQLLSSLDVTCVDALELRKKIPCRILNGWELKPFSILHSSYEEVLLLDADNVPVMDPTFLFETPEYKETGAIFWPDFCRLGKSRLIWSLCGVEYRNEPEFESGQILINKRKCWRPINLAMWYNEHSDFFYQHVHGDKETYHMAFRRLKAPYSMPPYSICGLEATMCQHDFTGRRIFQHRNTDKWNLFGENKRINGFLYEDECLKFLDDLRSHFKNGLGQVRWYDSSLKTEMENQAASDLLNRRFIYRRVGLDERPMTFLSEGRVGEGAARKEIFWDIRNTKDGVKLEIFSADDLTCSLALNENGSWHGRWLKYEQCPVEIFPMPA